MTVKCLTDVQKIVIVHQYRFLKLHINEIAQDAKRSRRTIVRVLEEAGYEPVKKRKPKQPKIDQTVSVELPELTPMEYLKCLFRAVFKKNKNRANESAA